MRVGIYFPHRYTGAENIYQFSAPVDRCGKRTVVASGRGQVVARLVLLSVTSCPIASQKVR